MITSGTTSGNGWQRVVQRVTKSGKTSDNEWQRVIQRVMQKQGDAMLWNSLGQFRKALIKIGKNKSLMAFSLAPK